ncbi:MAG: hypothetical protein JJ866_11045 [Roseibium sp.]|uniref:hypothetical protein n=1 Tax=Roseibium sp. TaxID=1936156 RepID=UPI001B1A8F96|nr:hypothetical protein [Roseibium sp.]MBO6892466.1 hypothetical protein [Roseibium sp.]MBO6932431.1 hypothetical protein [Roseibium sp.]
MTRIPVPEDGELDERTRDFISKLPDLNMVRMLARTGIAPEIYQSVSAIFNDDWFPALDREIMLFRTAHANNSPYEIGFHRAVYTFPEGLVDAILSDRLEQLDPWHRRLCEMCDEMAQKTELSPASVKELVDHYGGYNQATRAIFVMSWFNWLSRFADSTGVPLETAEQLAGVQSPTD